MEQELVITSYHTCTEDTQQQKQQGSTASRLRSKRMMTCKGFKRSKNMIEEQEYMKSC